LVELGEIVSLGSSENDPQKGYHPKAK